MANPIIDSLKRHDTGWCLTSTSPVFSHFHVIIELRDIKLLYKEGEIDEEEAISRSSIVIDSLILAINYKAKLFKSCVKSLQRHKND